MTTQTQGMVAAALAAVLIRLSWTGEYLRFVQPWMRWPLFATGVVLLLMALRPAFGMIAQSAHVPRTTWLLLLPTLVVFTVAPPPLGAYIAERRAGLEPSSLPAPAPEKLKKPTDGRPLALDVDEFIWGAAQEGDVMGLAGQPVRMEGFVSTDSSGQWYVTALVIFCCAADVAVERVMVVDQPAPPRNQWVRVTGTWVDGTGSDRSNPAQLSATDLVQIPTPEDPYS